jgi:hypothetical protein
MRPDVAGTLRSICARANGKLAFAAAKFVGETWSPAACIRDNGTETEERAARGEYPRDDHSSDFRNSDKHRSPQTNRSVRSVVAEA